MGPGAQKRRKNIKNDGFSPFWAGYPSLAHGSLGSHFGGVAQAGPRCRHRLHARKHALLQTGFAVTHVQAQKRSPSTQTRSPSTQKTSPSTKETIPDTQETNPDTQKTNPDTQKRNPSTQQTIPSTRLTNPGTRPQKTLKNIQKSAFSLGFPMHAHHSCTGLCRKYGSRAGSHVAFVMLL